MKTRHAKREIPAPLTKKQINVYKLLVENNNLVEIARILGKSPSTIHESLKSMEKKGWVINHPGFRPAWGINPDVYEDINSKALLYIANMLSNRKSKS